MCLSVYLSVFPRDISKTDAARITKLHIEMFLETNLVCDQKIKGQHQKAQKSLPALVMVLL